NPLIPCPSLNDIYEYARFDMEFFIDDRQDDLHGIIRYASKLFKPDTIRQLILHYKFLVEEIIKSGDVKIEAINMLSNHETKKLTIDWNKTDKEFPKNKTIYSLFEEQALRTPDSIAVSFEGTSLTYADLNDKANRLARKIRTIYQQRVAKTLQPDTLIALYLDRSVEMMVAVLAVLKAGAAYVPIDPGYPMERCRFMLEDTQSELILTLKSIVNNHSRPVEDNLTQQGYAQSKLLVIDLDEPLYQQMDGSNLEPY
ncbi:AMP-binding protein, partial [Salmonella enterica]|nr:AMP-binding protein [Salmonella enterica]